MSILYKKLYIFLKNDNTRSTSGITHRQNIPGNYDLENIKTDLSNLSNKILETRRRRHEQRLKTEERSNQKITKDKDKITTQNESYESLDPRKRRHERIILYNEIQNNLDNIGANLKKAFKYTEELEKYKIDSSNLKSEVAKTIEQYEEYRDGTLNGGRNLSYEKLKAIVNKSKQYLEDIEKYVDEIELYAKDLIGMKQYIVTNTAEEEYQSKGEYHDFDPDDIDSFVEDETDINADRNADFEEYKEELGNKPTGPTTSGVHKEKSIKIKSDQNQKTFLDDIANGKFKLRPVGERKDDSPVIRTEKHTNVETNSSKNQSNSMDSQLREEILKRGKVMGEDDWSQESDIESDTESPTKNTNANPENANVNPNLKLNNKTIIGSAQATTK